MHSKSIWTEYRQSLIIELSVLIYDETIVICLNLLRILLWLDLDETVEFECISNFSRQSNMANVALSSSSALLSCLFTW